MRSISIPIALLLVLGSCGSRAPILEAGTVETKGVRAPALPAPVPASPVYVVTMPRPLPPERLARLDRTPGVTVVSPIRIARVAVAASGGVHQLRVGSVDPLTFRSIAPAPSRDAAFVWEALVAGLAIPTPEAATRLGVTGGGRLTIGSEPPIDVGAFADNGTPNLVDVLVPEYLGGQMELGRRRRLVIGASAGASLALIGKELKKRLPGATVRRLARLPEVTASARRPQPAGRAEGGLIGELRFEILDDGFIRPDPAWVATNIATASVPVLGRITCHRLVFPQLGAALTEIQSEGLAGLIRIRDYAGCYVPRFIDRDATKPLSNHAFGLAFDLNASTNALGTRGDMDKRIVAIFEKWGFAWGGRWPRPDPMHFELARLVSV